VVVDSFVKDGKNVMVKRDLRFVDSFRFMASSLDALSKNLGSDECMNMNKFYKGEQFELLRKKGVYPYEWTNIERLSDGERAPKAFYSKLNECGISDEDYTHAQNVWSSFKCKTFTDYHDLYNVSDVLLLADIFENLRSVCLQTSKLDPA